MVKATINFNGKELEVEIKDGERYIDGMLLEDFIETLTPQELLQTTLLGVAEVKDQLCGDPSPEGRREYFLNHPKDCAKHILTRILLKLFPPCSKVAIKEPLPLQSLRHNPQPLYLFLKRLL